MAALEAERKRARETTEQRLRAEFQPVIEKAARADQLAADLTTLQPQLDYLRQHPEFVQGAQPPARANEPEISNDDAERYARQYELYTPTGLDIARAKRIISDNRTDMARVAKQAADEADAREVAPMRQTTDAQASRQNFLWAANQRRQDGSALVSPEALMKRWKEFPAQLTADPEVARVILDAVIGETVRSGGGIQPPEREPLYTESPGGSRQPAFQLSEAERRTARTAGLSEKQYTETAKTYQPNAINVLGD